MILTPPLKAGAQVTVAAPDGSPWRRRSVVRRARCAGRTVGAPRWHAPADVPRDDREAIVVAVHETVHPARKWSCAPPAGVDAARRGVVDGSHHARRYWERAPSGPRRVPADASRPAFSDRGGRPSACPAGRTAEISLQRAIAEGALRVPSRCRAARAARTSRRRRLRARLHR